MINCIYKDENTCANLVNSQIHDGTKLKFKAFAQYTQEWAYKIIEYYKDKVKVMNFIDCMASSGLYFDKDERKFFEGTAMQVFGIIENLSKKYNQVTFNIYLNDYNQQYVKCLECIRSKTIQNIPKNLNVYISNQDKNDFIQKVVNNPYVTGYYSKSLIIYDPYKVDFDWKILSPLLRLNADYLITHFYPNDLKRNVHTTSVESIRRYEETYELTIDQIKRSFDSRTSSYERSNYFRNIFHNKLKKYSNKGYLAYAPVIIGKKLHIYDIVCLSNSSAGPALLKDKMYTLYRNISQNKEDNRSENYLQLKFFDNELNIDRYEHDRKEDISEYNFHYDDSHIIEMFCDEFKAQRVSRKQLERRLKEHPYLPTNILNLVKKVWKYKIEKVNVNDKVERYYVFPDRSAYEQD